MQVASDLVYRLASDPGYTPLQLHTPTIQRRKPYLVSSDNESVRHLLPVALSGFHLIKASLCRISNHVRSPQNGDTTLINETVEVRCAAACYV